MKRLNKSDMAGRLGDQGLIPPSPTSTKELSRLKHDLMQAEVRLAKARATVVSAEIDIKVLNTRFQRVREIDRDVPQRRWACLVAW
jgi:hypothetical protein